MKPKVYIETSIPSFYYEVRSEPEMVARREWTRQWWGEAGDHYMLVTKCSRLGRVESGELFAQG